MASLGFQDKYNKILNMTMDIARDKHNAWKQKNSTFDPFHTPQIREDQARRNKINDLKEMGLFQEGIDTRKQSLLGQQQLDQGAQRETGLGNRLGIAETGLRDRLGMAGQQQMNQLKIREQGLQRLGLNKARQESRGKVIQEMIQQGRPEKEIISTVDKMFPAQSQPEAIASPFDSMSKQNGSFNREQFTSPPATVAQQAPNAPIRIFKLPEAPPLTGRKASREAFKETPKIKKYLKGVKKRESLIKQNQPASNIPSAYKSLLGL